MYKFLTVLLSLSFCTLAFSSEAEPGDAIGESRAAKAGAFLLGARAPLAVFDVLNGKQVDLRNVLGKKPIYLKFWATWCAPCREQMPHFEAVYQEYGESIAVFAVNVGFNESEAAIRNFRDRYKINMPIALDMDGTVGKQFNLQVTPQHVLINRAGYVEHIGHAITKDLNQKIKRLAQAASVNAPAVEKRAPQTTKTKSEYTGLSLKLEDGHVFTLPGKPDKETKQAVVLSFLATWCDWYLAETRPEMSANCIRQQQHINALQKQYGDKVIIIGIAQSLWTDAEQVSGYIERHKVDFPVGLDHSGDWFNHFKVRNVPTTILLDTDGKELQRLDANFKNLDQFLANIQ